MNLVTFLSTSPAWGTTYHGFLPVKYLVFLSTSPAWGTTLCWIIRRFPF